jgi:hypothetical protein
MFFQQIELDRRQIAAKYFRDELAGSDKLISIDIDAFQNPCKS